MSKNTAGLSISQLTVHVLCSSTPLCYPPADLSKFQMLIKADQGHLALAILLAGISPSIAQCLERFLRPLVPLILPCFLFGVLTLNEFRYQLSLLNHHPSDVAANRLSGNPAFNCAALKAIRCALDCSGVPRSLLEHLLGVWIVRPRFEGIWVQVRDVCNVLYCSTVSSIRQVL